MIQQETINAYVNNFNITSYLQAKSIAFKRSHRGICFCSPFRNEKNPSAVIYNDSKIYYDSSTGEKMSLLNFVSNLENCDFKKAVEIVSGNRYQSLEPISEIEYNSDIKGVYSELKTWYLFEYAKKRGINRETAQKYLSECLLNGKYHFLAFKNDKGGYAVRNNLKNAKTRWWSDGQNRPTTIKHQSNMVVIFEGAFDFLSWIEYMSAKAKPIDRFNVIVLNSCANVLYILPSLKEYTKIYLWLDKDKTGIETAEKIIKQYPDKVVNLTAQFIPDGCKDFNDFWIKHINSHK